MFKKLNIPVHLDGVEPALGKDKDGEQITETVLAWRIHPFSPELAAELDAMVRNTLWSIGKVDVQEKIKSIQFELKVPAFAIALKAAPDMSHNSLEIPYARLDKNAVVAKKHKDVAGWALTFKTRIPTPDANSLAFLHAGYTRQHWLTFEPAEPDLISAMEGEPAPSSPPPRRRKASSEGKAAPDVH